MVLMDDLAARLANRVQLTTDGHKAYLEAVEGAFGADIDYAHSASRFTGQFPKARRAVIALRNASALKNIGSKASRKRSTFRPHTWSAAISRSGCKTVASRG